MYCKNCGKKIEDSAKFCQNCGQTVNGVVQRPAYQRQVINFNTPDLWRILMFASLALWGICAFLMFKDWFAISSSVSDMFSSRVGDIFAFSILDMNNVSEISKYMDELDGLAVIQIAFFAALIVIAALLVLTIKRFYEEDEDLRKTGIAISVVFIVFTLAVIIAINDMISSTVEKDPIFGYVTSSNIIRIKTLGAPIFIIILSAAALGLTVWASKLLEQENYEYYESSRKNIGKITNVCKECGAYNSSGTSYCGTCGAKLN